MGRFTTLNPATFIAAGINGERKGVKNGAIMVRLRSAFVNAGVVSKGFTRLCVLSWLIFKLSTSDRTRNLIDPTLSISSILRSVRFL